MMETQNLPHALRRIGEQIQFGPVGTFYGIDEHGAALTSGEIALGASLLTAEASVANRKRWLVSLAVRLRHASDGVGIDEAATILTLARIDWSDVCWLMQGRDA